MAFNGGQHLWINNVFDFKSKTSTSLLNKKTLINLVSSRTMVV